MDSRSMAWRGAALLSSGTPRTEAPRSEPLADISSFKALPPTETHEAWMGTAYARWVERDVREKLSQRRDHELAALRLELEEERRRHAETAKRLEAAREQLGAVPQLQRRLSRARERAAAQLRREPEGKALGSTTAALRECFRAWALTSFRCSLDRALNPRPGVEGRPYEWQTLKNQMDAAFAKYAEAGAGQGEAARRAAGRAPPGYGLGATSAEEAALQAGACQGETATRAAGHASPGYGLGATSAEEAALQAARESPKPAPLSPSCSRMEDVGRPPAYGLPSAFPAERPPPSGGGVGLTFEHMVLGHMLPRGAPGPSAGGLGLAFDTTVQRTVPGPSTGALLRDRQLRWLDLPEP